MAEEPVKQEQPEQVEVTLKKPHTHAGKDYNVGDKIMVDEHDLELLKNFKVI